MRTHDNSNPKSKAPSDKLTGTMLDISQFIGRVKRELMRKYGYVDSPSSYDIVSYMYWSKHARKVAERYYQIFGITNRYGGTK